MLRYSASGSNAVMTSTTCSSTAAFTSSRAGQVEISGGAYSYLRSRRRSLTSSWFTVSSAFLKHIPANQSILTVGKTGNACKPTLEIYPQMWLPARNKQICDSLWYCHKFYQFDGYLESLYPLERWDNFHEIQNIHKNVRYLYFLLNLQLTFETFNFSSTSLAAISHTFDCKFIF